MIWDTPTNQQVPFDAETALNGFATMDSDQVGQIPSNHLSQLTTSAIDLSGQDEVFFSMQTHIGVFGVDASEGALLRVSTDLENWTDYIPFPNLDVGTRWSDNPEIPVLNISDAAANSATVYLQFQWNGNYEYHWSIDDIVLLDGDPRFENDLRVDDFYALAQNYSYPEGQLEEINFLADISNQGATEQTGVILTTTVLEDGTEVFSTQESFDPIPIDTAFENTLLPEAYTPTGGAGTVYTVNYTVSADAEDENPEDNTQTYNFIVTDTLFSKVAEPTATIGPAFNNGETDFQWAYGSHYHVVNGDGMFARTMTFSITGTDENAGQDIFVSIYKITDDGTGDPDNGNFRLVTPDERGNRIGVTIYTITGNEVFTDPITVPITQLNGDPVELEDGADYIAMIEFPVAGEINIAMGANREVSYDAQDLISDNLNLFRYAQILAVGNDIGVEDYSAGGFAGTVTPFVNLSIGDEPVSGMSSTNDFLSEENKIVVSPNPTPAFAIVGMDLEQMTEQLEISILDTKGALLQTSKYRNIQAEQLDLDVRELPTGLYFVRVRTDFGVATRRLVVKR